MQRRRRSDYTSREHLELLRSLTSRTFATACINAQMMIVRPQENVTRTRISHVLLTSKRAKIRFASIEHGAAVQQSLPRNLSKLAIPVPPIQLQREFARRVGAVEKLKTAQRASLAELDALFASLQHRAFRGEL